MTPYVLGDICIDVWKRAGVVIAAQVQTETHVSSSGGGGYVSESGGYVSAPQIHSRVTRQQDIWIQRANGAQECIRLNNSNNTNIPVIQGQRITVISAGKRGDTGYYAILINHDAAKWHSLADIGDLVTWMSIPSIQEVDQGSGCVIGCVVAPGLLWFSFIVIGTISSSTKNSSLIPYLLLGLLCLLVLITLISVGRSMTKAKANRQARGLRKELVQGLYDHLSTLGRETGYSAN